MGAQVNGNGNGNRSVQWIPSNEGLLVRGASGDRALLYRVLRMDDDR